MNQRMDAQITGMIIIVLLMLLVSGIVWLIRHAV